VREYGPFAGAQHAHGVSFDGKLVWFATGESLLGFDPDSGGEVRRIDTACHAGTAFDGRHFYQLADKHIHKIDPQSGAVVASLPAPGEGGDSGLTWAEGTLWVGQFRSRKIYQIDPDSGNILRTLNSDRFVTGVTWLDDQLWHGTWEGDESELRRIDADSGKVLERVEFPNGSNVSGLESNGKDVFYCGGGPTGKVRAIRRPR